MIQRYFFQIMTKSIWVPPQNMFTLAFDVFSLTIQLCLGVSSDQNLFGDFRNIMQIFLHWALTEHVMRSLLEYFKFSFKVPQSTKFI